MNHEVVRRLGALEVEGLEPTVVGVAARAKMEFH